MPSHLIRFYKFFPLPDYAERRAPLLAALLREGVKGSLLLAAEGINGTLAGGKRGLENIRAELEALPGCAPLALSWSEHAETPFGRAKVRLKKELISLGEAADPARRVGRYVTPAEWNALLEEDDVILIDARNGYETHLGQFPNALTPNTRKFRDLPAFTRQTLAPTRHRKIATYCTGGIRCEKYTAWLLDQGFEEVYHLEGGILRYMEQTSPQDNKFEGACYVFDERVAVLPGASGEVVKAGGITACPACGHSLKPEDRATADYLEALRCPHCRDHVPSNRVNP